MQPTCHGNWKSWELEIIDEILLRRILDAPAKTSLPSLYQELGCYPLKYDIIGKRLSFLHHILSCDEDRLIHQVFWAQGKSPVKNDWVLQVKDDLKSLDLDYLTWENIKNLKKEDFKEIYENKLKIKALESLNFEKDLRLKI